MSDWKRFDDSSLHPPPLPDPDAGDASPPPCYVLLDRKAYIADRRDHTTAYCATRDGGHIHATFVLAAPPAVSYLCVSSSAELGTEPTVLATDADLALLFSFLGSPDDVFRPYTHDHYVYQAGNDGARQPSLVLLPRPPHQLFPLLCIRGYHFHDRQVGIMRYRTAAGTSAFVVAALCVYDYVGDTTLALYTYDSDTNAWSCRPASFPDGKLPKSAYQCHKVITVGGEAGVMGWVNLTGGIIVCDVLPVNSDKTVLRHIPVPPPILVENHDPDDMYRDVAVVRGRIRYVEVQMHVRPGSGRGRGNGTFTSDGWTAVTWSRSVEETAWRKDHEVHAQELSSSLHDDGTNNMMVPGFVLLPTLRDDDGVMQPTLERIHVGHPRLGLPRGDDDEDIVYLMAKVNRRLEEAWVIAIDMKNKRLRGVAEFAGAQRSGSFLNSYDQSEISEFSSNMH